MSVRTLRLSNPELLGVLALALLSPAALGDLIPVSRTTTVNTSYNESYSGGHSESFSDGTSAFDFFAQSLTTSNHYGSAAQTSYLLSNGAYAEVAAHGYNNGSTMQHRNAVSNSVFTFVFELTTPTTLFINGSIDGDVFGPVTTFGYVQILNGATNQVVYNRSSGPIHERTVSFSDTYLAAAGRYRFVVSAQNSGYSGWLSAHSGAWAMLTTPTPGSAAVLLLGGLAASRRKL
jgi:hypothetical protein